MEFDAIRTQARVVSALILRELRTRFGREQLGYIWAVLEPSIYVAVFGLIFTLAGRPAPAGMPTVVFLITGIVPFLLFRNTMTRSISAILSNRPLLTFPMVTPLDLVVGRAILESATMFLVFIVMVLGAMAIGQQVRIENALLVLAALICIAMMGFGVGAFLGSFAIMFPSIERLLPSFIIRPLFFTSGLFFTASMVPEEFRHIVLLNPLLHGSELIRSGFFFEFESEHGQWSYILPWTVVDVFLGLVAQRALKRRILTATQQ